MPVINPKPGQAVPPAPPHVRIDKPGRANIVVDNQFNPKETLLSHVEGYSWTVTYYSQVLGRDTGAAGQGIGTDPVLQQYKRVNDMEIKVTSPLTSSQNEESSEMMVTGTANCYPRVIPNKGDVFVADLLDGRRAIFEVTSTQRMSVFRDAIHSMDYILVDFGTKSRLDDLASKVVQEAHFVKDFIYHGQNPVLLSDDYGNYMFLRSHLGLMIRQYFKRFYSREYDSIVMPDQGAPAYDGFLVNALFTHLDNRMAPELLHARRFNTEDDQATKADSIWTVLTQRERSLMSDIFQQVGLISTRHFQKHPTFDGIRYSGMATIVYPKDPMMRVDNHYTQNIKEPSDYAPVEIANPNRKDTPTDPVESMRGIKNAMADGYYIFSKEFYEDKREENSQSMLELAVQDFIDRKEIDYGRLRVLIEYSTKWNSLNSFYFVPVLIILTFGVIRSI